MFHHIYILLNTENYGWYLRILINLHLKNLSVSNIENKELNLYYQ